jgi:PhzF family phenazine biosynthesis protein
MAEQHSFPTYWVDAFTDGGNYKGNPAAVVSLPCFLPDPILQDIAHQNGLSETAFFVSRGGGVFDLRWMTPEEEVDLCGHATLAAAHVVFTHYHSGPTITFSTLSGSLLVARDSRPGHYTMTFPSRPPVAFPEGGVPQALLPSLGLSAPGAPTPCYIGRARDILVHLPRVEDVRAITPDFAAMLDIDALCIIVSALETSPESPYQIVSRVFCPGCGVPEDPVTGSAHCTVAPYFSGVLGGRERLRCLQASARGGVLDLQLLPPNPLMESSLPNGLVCISGTCSDFTKGELFVRLGRGEVPPALQSPAATASAEQTSLLMHALDTFAAHHGSAHCSEGGGAGGVPAAPSAPPLRVTLTYAQSLDGALASARGAHTLLSCQESLAMTHMLRARHCAILVGVGTVLSDNPRLNTRLCPGASPTVCILDPHLLTPPASNALDCGAGQRAPAIIFHGGVGLVEGSEAERAAFTARKAALTSRGAKLVQLPLHLSGSAEPWLELQGPATVPASPPKQSQHLCFSAAFAALQNPPFSFKSLMVEGGARVHASLVSQHLAAVERKGRGGGLVSAVVVTISPRLLGGGVHIASSDAGSTKSRGGLDLVYRHVARIGTDIVVLAVPGAMP